MRRYLCIWEVIWLCQTVVRAQVHPSVTVIPDSTVCTVYSAFQGRQNLDVIDLCDGLIEIGNDAFIYCSH